MDTRTDIDLGGSDWEARQKHAAFFQAMIVSTQQAAGSCYAVTAVLITLGIGLANMPGQATEHRTLFLQASVWVWVVVAMVMTAIFRTSAQRINRTYRNEHARLFPGATPYSLESFLLVGRIWL